MLFVDNLDAATIQRNYEASIKCLKNKVHPCTLQYSTTHSEGFLELQNGFHAQPGGSFIDPDCFSGNEYLQSSKECIQYPVYHHDFGSWSGNPDSKSVSLCQLNAFHGQFHPNAVNYRFQYAPVNMFPQNYPYDYQFQDFQYFVVIDFEATCEKENIPHPQEIIEFPSVIVSSITGQLEACFQTYVRPTCNQVLSEFCKDLTGIQQIQVNIIYPFPIYARLCVLMACGFIIVWFVSIVTFMLHYHLDWILEYPMPYRNENRYLLELEHNWHLMNMYTLSKTCKELTSWSMKYVSNQVGSGNLQKWKNTRKYLQ